MELSSILLLGALSIFVGTLIGTVGIGGILLVPILTYILGIDVHVAIAAAMFSYIFSGIVGSVIYAREGSIQWSMAGWLFAGATPAAFLGAMVASTIPGKGLEVIIALFIVFAGVNALRGQRRGADGETRQLTNPFALIGIGAVTGVGSALTGTGGPLVLVPTLVSLKVAAHTAIGLSQAIQLPIATLATAGNYLYGTVDWLIGGIIAASLVIGSAMGAKLAHVISPAAMSRIVAWVLVAVGIFILSRLTMGWISP